MGMTKSEHQDGRWIYRKVDASNLWSQWSITNTETGETLDKLAHDIPDARRIVVDHVRTTQAARYTIASGPERAQQTRRHTSKL